MENACPWKDEARSQAVYALLSEYETLHIDT